jgi:hypothetical protein
MTPRSGITLFFAFLAVAFVAIGGCGKYSTPAPPKPGPSVSPSPFPDTLYVQDTTSRAVRVYKNASGLNGFAAASSVLKTNSISFDDAVYSPEKDVLWVPLCAGAPCPGQALPVDVYAAASTLNNVGPTSTSAPLTDINGAAAYDLTDDLLFVTVNNAPDLEIYSSASTLGVGANTTPAAKATLNITDPGIQYQGVPRPQELYYDKARDILFASDFGTVVAEFDAFGAQAAAAAATHTDINLTSSRQITALIQTDGMAYNTAQDILFVVSDQRGLLTIISSASTTNGPATHAQTVTGFANPKGLALDDIRNILFVYDPGNPNQEGQVLSFPNATTLAGNQAAWAGRKGFVDGFIAGLSGFGIAIDTSVPSPSPSP